MLASNTNRLTWVGITVGIIAALGLATTAIFPSAMDSAQSQVKHVVIEFVDPDKGFGINNPQSDDYQYNDDGTAYLTNYHQTSKDVVVPSTIHYGGKDYSVTRINDGAVQGKGINSIVIPGSVTAIGNSSFSSNNLTSVSIPDSVKSIETNAFAGNKLTSVTFGSGLMNIGSWAFQNNNIKSITFDDNLKTIGSGAFQGNAFETIALPDKITSIGDWAFTMSDSGSYVKTITAAPVDIMPGGINYNANAFDAGVVWTK